MLAFPDAKWPRGWRAIWVEDLEGAFAEAHWNERLVKVCAKGARDCSAAEFEDTLIHEMVHMLYYDLPHGRKFSARVREAKKRVKKARRREA